MIKRVKILNFAGIKECNTSFKLKSIRDNHKTIEEQVIMDGEEAYSLFPTFLSKNSSGKTSFIKAIEFVSRFVQKDSFVKWMTSSVSVAIQDLLFKLVDIDLEQDGDIVLDSSEEIIDLIIKQLFKEVSYVGSETMSIEIDFHGGNKVVVQGSQDDFIFDINANKYSLRSLLRNTLNAGIPIKGSQYEIKESIKKGISASLGKVSFFGALIVVHHHGVDKKWVNTYIETIVKEFGYKPLITLLKKIDNKIVSVEQDVETKGINIFVTGESLMPISPSNLSNGTIRTLQIISESITLFKNKGVMLIDEIENSLHLSLIKLITEFYSNEDINIAGSQLILTTHNALLFERDIIMPRNAFVSENGVFVSIGNSKVKTRYEDMVKLVSSKNYYNDMFWIKHDQEPKSTLTNINVTRVVNEFGDSVNGGKDLIKK